MANRNENETVWSESIFDQQIDRELNIYANAHIPAMIYHVRQEAVTARKD